MSSRGNAEKPVAEPTTTLITHFLTLPQTIAIASRYTRLLHQLWFQLPHSATEPCASDKAGIRLDSARRGLEGGLSSSVFDDCGLGVGGERRGGWASSDIAGFSE